MFPDLLFFWMWRWEGLPQLLALGENEESPCSVHPKREEEKEKKEEEEVEVEKIRG